MSKLSVDKVIGNSDTTRIAIVGLMDEPGVAFKLFKSLAKHDINVDMILQSVGRKGTKDISFTVSDECADEAEKIIYENFNNFESIDVDKEVSKVSIVGKEFQTTSGIAARMFEALYDVSINIKMISTSDSRVTVLIDELNFDDAMTALNNAFSIKETE